MYFKTYSQSINSLIEITKNGDKEEQVNANIGLSNYYFYSVPDTAELYLNQALEIAKKYNFKRKESIIYLNLGILYNERGITSTAETYFLEAIKIAKVLNDSTVWVASLGNLGNSAMYYGDYAKALDYFTQIIGLYKKNNDYEGLGNTYGAIGNIYINIDNYDKAIDYYNSANEYFLKANDTISSAIVKLNLASIYTDKSMYDTAEQQYKNALVIFEKSNQQLNKAECLSGLAKIYSLTNQAEKSFLFYSKALNIYKTIDAQKNISQCYIQLANLKLAEGDNTNAIKYYDSAYNISYDLQNYQQLAKITQQLHQIYYNQNNLSQAYKYLSLYKKFSDSLTSIESLNKFHELEIKFETKQKQQQIEILTKENEIAEEKNKRKNLLIAILVLSIISAGLIFILLYNRRKLIHNQEQIITEQKLHRLQMNPHFIYNSLLSVQNFMLENDSENSIFYISKFAKLMRKILQSTAKDFINLSDELEILGLYVDFQKLRSSIEFNYIVKIDKKIDAENTLIPPMLIQPFIENSIKYAFNKNSKKPYIQIEIIKERKQLKITISDNGGGIKNSIKSSDINHKSMSINITKKRLKMMFVKKNVIFTIEDLSEKNQKLTGTQITIKIPLIQEF